MQDLCFDDDLGLFFMDGSSVKIFLQTNHIIRQACPSAQSSIVLRQQTDKADFFVWFDLQSFINKKRPKCEMFLSNIGYCCKTCQKLEIPTLICQNCFSQLHKRNGHQYQILEVTKDLEGKIKCSCGDFQLLKTSGMCQNHSQTSITPQIYALTKQYIVDCFKILFELRYESYGILDKQSHLLNLSKQYQKQFFLCFNDICQEKTDQVWLQLLSDCLVSPITVKSAKRKVEQRYPIIFHLLNQQIIQQNEVFAIKKLIKYNHFYFSSKTLAQIIKNVEEETMNKLFNLTGRQQLPYCYKLLSWLIASFQGVQILSSFGVEEIFPNKKQAFNKSYRMAAIKILSFIVSEVVEKNFPFNQLNTLIQKFESHKMFFIDLMDIKIVDKFLLVMVVNQQTEICSSLLKQLQANYKKKGEKEIISVLDHWVKRVLQLKDINFEYQKYFNRRIMPKIYGQIQRIVKENGPDFIKLPELLRKKVEPSPVILIEHQLQQNIIENLDQQPQYTDLSPARRQAIQSKRNRLNKKFSLVNSNLLLKFGVTQDIQIKEQVCIICREPNKQSQHLIKTVYFGSRRPALKQVLDISFQSNLMFKGCMHSFHISCLIQNIKKNGSLAELCPLCKQNMNFTLYSKLQESGNIETEFLQNSYLGRLFRGKSLEQVFEEVYCTMVTFQYEYLLFNLLEKKMDKTGEKIGEKTGEKRKRLTDNKQKILSLLNTLKSVYKVLELKVKRQIRVRIFQKLKDIHKFMDKKTNEAVALLYLASWLFISSQKQQIKILAESNIFKFSDLSPLSYIFDQNIIMSISELVKESSEMCSGKQILDYYIPQLPAYSILLYANFKPICARFKLHIKSYYLCLFCNKLICPSCHQIQNTHFMNFHKGFKFLLSFTSPVACFQFIRTPIKKSFEIYQNKKQQNPQLVQTKTGTTLMRVYQLNKQMLYQIFYEILEILRL